MLWRTQKTVKLSETAHSFTQFYELDTYKRFRTVKNFNSPSAKFNKMHRKYTSRSPVLSISHVKRDISRYERMMQM